MFLRQKTINGSLIFCVIDNGGRTGRILGSSGFGIVYDNVFHCFLIFVWGGYGLDGFWRILTLICDLSLREDKVGARLVAASPARFGENCLLLCV